MGLLNRTRAFTSKQESLNKLYEEMATHGHSIASSEEKEKFDNTEIRHFKRQIKEVFDRFDIKTALDYGCGETDYMHPFSANDPDIPFNFFNLTNIHYYEPSRGIDQRRPVDAVICTDVLEHVFISDVPNVIREIFELSRKLIFINVACYESRALLPNGEMAHITIRSPEWWKGVFQTISIEYPQINVCLYCATSYNKGIAYPVWNARQWLESSTFSTT